MMRCVGLLRGINVGRSNRVPMAELRALMDELGFESVRTLLNSGNVVFDVPARSVRGIAERIERGIEGRFGFAIPVVVITAAQLDEIVKENPLISRASKDPSKFLVAFLPSRDQFEMLEPLVSRTWAPEAFAVAAGAGYLWCERGIIESKLVKELVRLTGGAVTTRNWATVLKLQVAAAARVVRRP